MTAFVTRFAPSPTGWLHAGHACSALFAWRQARTEQGGRFLLRIEDIDIHRCREEFVTGLQEDLLWLGEGTDFRWEVPLRRQSANMADYSRALEILKAGGLVYPCFCTRKEIQSELSEMFGAPHLAPSGSDGPLYPGICRNLSDDMRSARIDAGEPHAWRLDMAKAAHVALKSGQKLLWEDLDAGCRTLDAENAGDIVLARKDIPASYHLAVTLDDHLQGITLVTRGMDLFAASHIHRLLQILLGLSCPLWHHHPLILDESGQRMAKRRGSESLRDLRLAGRSPADIRSLLPPG